MSLRQTPVLLLLLLWGCQGAPHRSDAVVATEPGGRFPAAEKVVKTEGEWYASLDYKAYQTLRQGATEWPYTGELWELEEVGTYRCAGCGLPLFHSRDKYDSGTGWPSYTRAIDDRHLYTIDDRSRGTPRLALRCSRCDGHLGHLFPDGPPPSGHRYCVNSSALTFVPERSSATRDWSTH